MSRQVAAKRFDRPHSLPGSSFRATNLDLAAGYYHCAWFAIRLSMAVRSYRWSIGQLAFVLWGVLRCCRVVAQRYAGLPLATALAMVALCTEFACATGHRCPQLWFSARLSCTTARFCADNPHLGSPECRDGTTLLVLRTRCLAQSLAKWCTSLAWSDSWHCVVGCTGNSYPPAILGAFLTNIKAYTLFVARHTSQSVAHCILCCIVLPFGLDVSNLFYPSAGRPATRAACPLFNLALSDISCVYIKYDGLRMKRLNLSTKCYRSSGAVLATSLLEW